MLKIYKIDLDTEAEDEEFIAEFHNALGKNENLSTISKLFKETLSGELTADDISLQNHIIDISYTLQQFITSFTNDKTAQLWLMYVEMVSITCKLTKAQRTGNWKLHLDALSETLPYFASSGHYLYLKSAYLYLQCMHELPDTNPSVYAKFTQGYHVVRRSDAFWAGLPTDLVIEQELMRSVKSVGGLTRGRGMT